MIPNRTRKKKKKLPNQPNPVGPSRTQPNSDYYTTVTEIYHTSQNADRNGAPEIQNALSFVTVIWLTYVSYSQATEQQQKVVSIKLIL